VPNPHWVDELRPLTGLDEPVRDYVLGQPAAGEFLDNLETLLVQLLPAYVAEGKAYLTIALGCTGGRHRSVAIAEELARRLRNRGQAAAVLHRDVDKVDA
jgi:RNase adapter protein RapZ